MSPAIEITGPLSPGFEEMLTPKGLAFLVRADLRTYFTYPAAVLGY